MKNTMAIMITVTATPAPIPAFAPVLSDDPSLFTGCTVGPSVLVAASIPVPLEVSVVAELGEEARADVNADVGADVGAVEAKSGNGFCGPDRCTAGAAVNNASSSPQQ